VPTEAAPELAKARAASPVLDQMVTMREELRQLWLNTSRSREQLLADLQAWCHRAEAQWNCRVARVLAQAASRQGLIGRRNPLLKRPASCGLFCAGIKAAIVKSQRYSSHLRTC